MAPAKIIYIVILKKNHENDMNGYFRRFSKLPNGTMENRRTSTIASRRIPSMERGRIHLFSLEDGRIPSFNAFLTKNVLKCPLHLWNTDIFAGHTTGCTKLSSQPKLVVKWKLTGAN